MYYPVLQTALDIPPWTRKLESLLSDYWDDLMEIEDPQDRLRWIDDTPRLKRTIQREGLGAEEISTAIDGMQAELAKEDAESLKVDEYRALSSTMPEIGREFETHPLTVPGELAGILGGVVRVARLREVRVITGFTRINPPYDPDGPEIAPISAGELEWLPAIEIRGEGIFLRFDVEPLERWENLPSVLARCDPLDSSWAADWAKRAGDRPKSFDVTPRLLLVHSFAHALIRQLTLECGYSTASLRERLYVSEGPNGMAGVLIYTGTPDADGTLGGLQSRARPPLLEPTVVGALKSMRWCSSDPLCIHGEMAAPESHSGASCHACVMLPETSCELHNRFLDRALLVGSDDDPSLGLLKGLAG